MEVEPLDEIQLEDLGLNTYNRDIPLSSREVPSLDEPKPQPQPLPNCPPLEISLGDKRGPKPPIKPHSPDSFRMKVVDHLTIHTPPSPHAASFHPKDIYCYYHPCVDDPKKHYRFKPGLLGQGGPLGVDLSNWEVIENNFLRGLSLPVKPNELEKVAGDGVRINLINHSLTTLGDANPICTIGDYSRPSHEGYRNTIEIPEGNNVVPLRSDTIRLVQNGCSFYELRSEDPNQHLKDFLKLVDSLDLDVANKERTRLLLFQFSFRDQASNWLKCLLTGSISTWGEFTTRFLSQFSPPRRTAKLRNDILMFQQHQGESLSEAWARFKDLLQKFPRHGIDLWLQV
ncbi:zinc finger, CCHC-type containing protein [Tanacetum coccineum]